MTTRHHYHLDIDGHSVSLDLRTGFTWRTEDLLLLVDGKEVGYHHQRGTGTTVLEAELPGEPPTPISVRVDHPHHGGHRPHTPVCTLLTEGRKLPMPESVPA
ncbi:hypothetical protein DN069_32950 [Streptacidiphilus pinicola]|uniref:Uncharacterized protein n=1 Tax=Streptacidiphilus pinicola TaxID=2219663 RepID=A0A2X0J1Y0_9ACTN|nr:hypothetical protein [Streptacidiphilus pinicola]RAG81388.1 hypothetical protein DN069_32950 [Streptacidiphilus pinicola]